MEIISNETHITHYIYVGRIQKNTRVAAVMQKWYSSFAMQFNIHQKIYPAVCTLYISEAFLTQDSNLDCVNDVRAVAEQPFRTHI